MSEYNHQPPWIEIHAKKTVGTVWCGQGIFGKITDHEGNPDWKPSDGETNVFTANGHYKVTCQKCKDRKNDCSS